MTSCIFLDKEMANHSSILVWRNRWTEEPGRLQSMGLQRLDNNNNNAAYCHLNVSSVGLGTFPVCLLQYLHYQEKMLEKLLWNASINARREVKWFFKKIIEVSWVYSVSGISKVIQLYISIHLSIHSFQIPFHDRLLEDNIVPCTIQQEASLVAQWWRIRLQCRR